MKMSAEEESPPSCIVRMGRRDTEESSIESLLNVFNAMAKALPSGGFVWHIVCVQVVSVIVIT